MEVEAEPMGDARLEELRSQIEALNGVQAELSRAKSAAEAALMTKSEFLATMSHEIRTPLNGMLPLLELVLAHPLPDSPKEHLRTVYASSRELLRIVNDVLDYSRVESGKMQLESTSFNLKEAVDAVTKLMGRSAEAKSLTLEARFDSNVRLAVRGDALRLRQVLTNLVSNAIKFTERGGVHIEVTKKKEARAHYVLQFSVRDSGIGLSPDAAQKLFLPFSQADASTTRQFGGTGLGLAICRRIVEAMGGKIGVSSQLGRGSTFWFSIPLLKTAGDIQTPHGTEHVRAIILCRDRAMQDRLVDHLRSLRVQTVMADTTLDALRIVRAGGVAMEGSQDVIILDHQTFSKTARALIRALATEEALTDVRAIILDDGQDIPAEIKDSSRASSLQRDHTASQLSLAMEHALRVAEDGASEDLTTGPTIEIGPREVRVSLEGRTILLVDDIPINRKVGQRLLEKMGATVQLAEDGREALRLLERTRYDAVLLDCQMPGVDGYTATRAQRTREHHEGRERTPIIAMTANAMPGDREKCLAAGMDDYIPKPLDHVQLADTLKLWLREGGIRQVSPDGCLAANSIPQMNMKALGSLYDGLNLGEAQLAERWYRDTKRSIAQIKLAAEQQDGLSAARSAAALRSSSGLLGAHSFSRIAAEVEDKARARLFDKVGADTNLLDNECERIWRVLSV